MAPQQGRVVVHGQRRDLSRRQPEGCETPGHRCKDAGAAWAGWRNISAWGQQRRKLEDWRSRGGGSECRRLQRRLDSARLRRSSCAYVTHV